MADQFQLSAELEGHDDQVRAVCAYPPINGGIVTASIDRTLKVWSPKEGHQNEYSCTRDLVGHDNFVVSVSYIHTPAFPTATLISASLDKRALLWDVDSAAVVGQLVGHEGPVSCLYVAPNGDVITGSWDKTARVWSNGTCVQELKGHAANVLCVLGLQNGVIVTGSGDNSIKLWRDGTCFKTYQAHSSCVRGLIEYPGIGFFSCSNDGSVRLWDSNGSQLMEVVAHSNLVYSLVILPTGEIATASEDRSVKIWKDGNCVQTIEHPGCVWDVKVLSNGDIVTACSDAVARIFTRSLERVATQPIRSAFDSKLDESKKKVGGVDVNSLPGAEALNVPGKREGETKIVKVGTGAEVHKWDDKAARWEKLGDVVDQGDSTGLTANTGPTMYKGKYYDYVFSIDLPGGGAADLPFNLVDNPYQRAQEFIWEHDIEQHFLDQIAQHIIQNTPQNVPSQQQGSVLLDPFTGGSRYVPTGGQAGGNAQQQQPMGDPLTSGGRYVPTSYAPPPRVDPNADVAFSEYAKELQRAQQRKQQQQQSAVAATPATIEKKHFPVKTAALFPTGNYAGIMTKLNQFNTELESNPATANLSLTPEERQLLDGAVNQLKAATTPAAAATVDIPVALFALLQNKLLNWPCDKLFPIVDLLRLVILNTKSANYLLSSNTAESLLKQLLRDCFIRNSGNIAALHLLCLRFIANMFSSIVLKSVAVKSFEDVINAIKLNEPNNQTRIAYASVLLNYSISVTTEEHKLTLLATLAQAIVPENDAEAVYRMLTAIGSLIHKNASLQKAAGQFLIREIASARLLTADQNISETCGLLLAELKE